MNIFERDALEKDEQRRTQGILAVWGSFEGSMLELLDSYNNAHPDAQRYGPGEVAKKTSTALLIVCPRGSHPKENSSSLMITVRAQLLQRRFRIECKIERWTKRMQNLPPQTDHIHRVTFTLGADHNSLLLDEGQLTPGEAAEMLLGCALISK